MCCLGFVKYLRDKWNIVDQLMYVLLALAIVLRFILTDDDDFQWARNVYAISLVIFYMRILELYLIHLQLGPKIVMIGRMVCVLVSIIDFLHF